MKIFSWSKSGYTSSSLMTWVDCTKDAAGEAARIAPILKPLPRRGRCLAFRSPLDRSFTIRTTPADLLANGPDAAADTAWFTTFYTELQSLGATISRISLDVENEINYWTLPNPEVQAAAFYATPSIVNRMSPALQRFVPADYIFGGTNNDRLITVFNEWCEKIFGDVIRVVVPGTYRKVFGRDVAISNYEDVFAAFAVRDANNWPVVSNPVNQTSSPDLYIDSGNRYTMYGLKLNPYWNRFLDCIRMGRSCVASGKEFAPYISYPSFGATAAQPASAQTWLWSQLVMHLNALGVRTILYWNPTGTYSADDEKAADAVFKSLKNTKPAPEDLVDFALDSQSITTGNVATTYARFLAQLPKAAA